MKKLMFACLALCLALSVSAVAGDSEGAVKLTGIVTDPMCAKSGDKSKMANAECAKKCSEHDGGKLAFVNMDDGTLWSIENTDAVKGHEGHQVELNAHLNKEKGSIHVVKVSMTDDNNNKNDKLKKGDSKKEEKKPS
jgi:type 1 fimbria pilin